MGGEESLITASARTDAVIVRAGAVSEDLSTRQAESIGVFEAQKTTSLG